MESDILFTQKNYNNDIYDKFNQDKQNNDEYISNINDKIIEKKNINEDTHNYTDENLISFDYTKKLFDINKINESFIIHMKNDDIFFCTSLYNKYKMRKSSKKKINKLKKRKYNFIQDDVCSTIYDEMVYFNNNEINTIIEGNNNVNNNFDFIKVEHNMERIMNKTNYDLYNDNQKNNMDDRSNKRCVSSLSSVGRLYLSAFKIRMRQSNIYEIYLLILFSFNKMRNRYITSKISFSSFSLKTNNKL